MLLADSLIQDFQSHFENIWRPNSKIQIGIQEFKMQSLNVWSHFFYLVTMFVGKLLPSFTRELGYFVSTFSCLLGRFRFSKCQ